MCYITITIPKTISNIDCRVFTLDIKQALFKLNSAQFMENMGHIYKILYTLVSCKANNEIISQSEALLINNIIIEGTRKD